MGEKLSSRLGFLMLAAGCAVGLGNVWRFPFIVGENGGAAFVLVYLAFLALLGFPLLLAELAIGRGSGHGVTRAMRKLCAGRATRFWAVVAVTIFFGNALLMAYYTDVSGWLLKYAVSYGSGGETPVFASLAGDRATCGLMAGIVIAGATAVCALGLNKGVEKSTKVMMFSLLLLLGVLAVRSLTLPGAREGLSFYLRPDWSKLAAHPAKVMFEAMGQAFFTLSLGLGAMAIFGAYVDRRYSLVSGALWIVVIDTAVALTAGLVIFPACATYGVRPDCGPGLIFTTLPRVFAQMAGGRIWGGLFFLSLCLAAFTTVVAEFECMIGGLIDEFGWRRMPTAFAVGLAMAAAGAPCVLWDGVLGIEDFVLSKISMPFGALVVCLFVTRRFGWGAEGFRTEVGRGIGLELPSGMMAVMRWGVPTLIVAVVIGGFAS